MVAFEVCTQGNEKVIAWLGIGNFFWPRLQSKTFFLLKKSLTHSETSGNWWQPVATGGNQWQLVATSGNWWQPVATGGNQWQLVATGGNSTAELIPVS